MCAEPLGCVACDPDSSQCAGEVSQKCKPDGSGWVDDESCDPLQGVMCDAMSGKCAGPCSSALRRTPASLASPRHGTPHWAAPSRKPTPWATCIVTSTGTIRAASAEGRRDAACAAAARTAAA